MSSEHSQTSYEKYGCSACSLHASAGERHDPQCPKFEQPKKPTETEIIREQCADAMNIVSDLMARGEQNSRNGASGGPLFLALVDRLKRINVANEARDKSRTLSGVSFTVPTEEHYRALLEIGFDLALQAVVPQLSTVVQIRGCTSWTPPDNPFTQGPGEAGFLNHGTRGEPMFAGRNPACTCPPGAQRIHTKCPVHGCAI